MENLIEIQDVVKRFGEQTVLDHVSLSAYSLVMALSRHIPLQQIRIYATDLDKQVIAKAKTGLTTAFKVDNYKTNFIWMEISCRR